MNSNHNGHDKYSDTYDAMAEDFSDPNLNCYTGSGAQIPYTRKKSDVGSIKLYVANIPREINEAGLVSIFTKESFKGFNPFVGKSQDPKRRTGWGFIEFKSVSEAQNAISTLHRQPPYSLFITFARGPEDKQGGRYSGGKPNKSSSLTPEREECDSSVSDPMMPISRGRGMTYTEGKRPSSYAVKKLTEEPYYGEDDTDGYSSTKFMPPEDNHELNASNDVFYKATELVSDNGLRKVSMGRGSFVAPTNKDHTSSNVSSSSNVIDDKLDMMFSAYLSRLYKTISCDENLRIVCDSQNPLSIMFRLGSCINCQRPSLYVCTTCKGWYCSNSCRLMDYDRHQPECIPHSVVEFDSNGDLKLAPIPDEFADSEEVKSKSSVQRKNTSYDRPPEKRMSNPSEYRLNEHKDRTPRHSDNQSRDLQPLINDSLTYFKSPTAVSSHNSLNRDSFDSGNEEKTPRSHNYRNVNETNNYDNDISLKTYQNNVSPGKSDRRSGGGQANWESGEYQSDHARKGQWEGGHPNRAVVENRTGSNAKRGQHNFEGGNNQRDSGEKNRRGPNDYSRRGGYKGGKDSRASNDFDDPDPYAEKINEPTVRNDKRIQVPRISNVENGVYKRTSDTPPERRSQQQGSEMKKISDSYRCADPPIPFDRFSEVTVSALSSVKNKFWGYPNSANRAQAEIMCELNNQSKMAKPVSNIVLGLRVSAPFCGDWYRAEVKNIEQNGTVTVFFVDFGNECSVDKNSLLPLPSSFTDTPEMAHQFIFADSPTNPELQTESSLKLKPINNVGGVWVVHAEGAVYNNDRAEEVTIMVTEGHDQYWVCSVRDKIFLEEMTSGLEEHKEITVTPTINELYSASLKHWLRARVVNTCPLSVFCIDYGFVTSVRRQDLHPLPPKYSDIPPMAFKIKLTDGSTHYKVGSNIRIKTLLKFEDIVLCEVVKSVSKVPNASKMVKHVLDKLSTEKLSHFCIEKVLNEEVLSGFIILNEDLPSHVFMSDIISKKEKQDVVLAPGLKVAALWDDMWHRGYVMALRGNDTLVALIDRARVVIPKTICSLPSGIDNFPETGVKVIFQSPLPHGESTKTGIVHQCMNVKALGNKVEAEIESLGKATLHPWEPMIEEAGLSVVSITSGSKVGISSFSGPYSMFVHSCKKKDILTKAELMQDIATHCLLTEPLKRKPLIGEVLAVSYSDGQFYRAKMYKKEGDLYKVIFIDFGNVASVKIRNMKPLSDGLKSIPCFAVKVGLKGLPDVPLTKYCIHYLNEICVNATAEFKITFENNNLNEVFLHFENGECLNKILKNLLTPSWKKEKLNLIKSEVFTESDLEFEKWEKGGKFEVVVAAPLSHNRIAVLRTDTCLFKHIQSTLTRDITEYCQSFDSSETYNPRRKEVCLALFEEDNKWYRAICQNPCTSESSEIFYLDFGNSGLVHHKNIRKMIPDFMSTPVALKICEVYGLPAVVPDDAKEGLIEYFDQFQSEVIVLESDNEEPVLWIPSLVQFAGVLGLPIKTP